MPVMRLPFIIVIEPVVLVVGFCCPWALGMKTRMLNAKARKQHRIVKK